jgi:hypothetical protein
MATAGNSWTQPKAFFIQKKGGSKSVSYLVGVAT